MLTVSLHGIRIQAAHGLYPQEQLLHNEFEIDVDIHIPARGGESLPYVDYTLIHDIVTRVFEEPGKLLETFVQHIYNDIRNSVPEAEKISVAIRKMHLPVQGEVHYAQVKYED